MPGKADRLAAALAPRIHSECRERGGGVVRLKLRRYGLTNPSEIMLNTYRETIGTSPVPPGAAARPAFPPGTQTVLALQKLCHRADQRSKPASLWLFYCFELSHAF